MKIGHTTCFQSCFCVPVSFGLSSFPRPVPSKPCMECRILEACNSFSFAHRPWRCDCWSPHAYPADRLLILRVRTADMLQRKTGLRRSWNAFRVLRAMRWTCPEVLRFCLILLRKIKEHVRRDPKSVLQSNKPSIMQQLENASRKSRSSAKGVLSCKPAGSQAHHT